MFDFRDRQAIETTLAIMSFPFTYCISSAISKGYLPIHLLANGDFMRLLQVFESSQLACENNGILPYSRESISKVIFESEELRPIKVQPSTNSTNFDIKLIDLYSKNVNQLLLDSLASIFPKKNNGLKPNQVQIAKLSYCVWLSQLIGICILGIGTVDAAGSNTLRVHPIGDLSKLALRRTWFGVAFEKQSQLVDEIRIKHLAQSLPSHFKFADKGEVADLCRNLCAKWWRLDYEGIPNLFWSEVLLPTFVIFLNVIRLEQNLEYGHFSRKDAEELRNGGELFNQIVEHQAGLDPIDRIFTMIDDCLITTKRNCVEGFMTLAEGLLEKRFSNKWRGTFSLAFEHYVKFRFSEEECKKYNFRVISKELFKHDSSTEAKLDVDLFIVDDSIGVVYAIQLKHLAHGYRSTLIDYIKWFRKHDSKLELAVQQLKDLRSLSLNDPKTRSSLLEIGFTMNEIKNICPIVLHNIGLLDCWKLKEGVFLYDWHTFRQVLIGRSVQKFRIEDRKKIEVENIAPHLLSTANPTDPESIVSQYANDARLESLVQFDIAARMRTSAHICGTLVEADGLGL